MATSACFASRILEVVLPVHPNLDRRIRLLARQGLGAAEVRRRLRPRAAALDVSVPCYTRILETVQSERLRAARERDGRIAVAGVFYGRVPVSAVATNGAGTGAHVHKRVFSWLRSRRRVRLRRRSDA